MSTLAELVAFITEDEAFAAVAGERLYPITLPQTPVLPAVTYMVASYPNESTQDGGVIGWPRIQFDAYAKTYVGVYALANIVVTRLAQLSAAYGGDDCQVDDLRDIEEPNMPPLGERFRVSFDVTIWGLRIEF